MGVVNGPPAFPISSVHQPLFSETPQALPLGSSLARKALKEAGEEGLLRLRKGSGHSGRDLGGEGEDGKEGAEHLPRLVSQ